jgi:hypothetical protein
MYATGPLVSPDGDLLNVAPPAPVPAPIVVRCIDRAGRDVAAPVILSGPLGREALSLLVGDALSGEVDADRFSRRAFRATCEWQDAKGRGAMVCRRLYQLDRLATAAVKNEIPATITWAPSPIEE